MTTTIATIKERLTTIGTIFKAYYANPSDEAWEDIDGDALALEEEELEAELGALEAELEEEYESDGYDADRYYEEYRERHWEERA